VKKEAWEGMRHFSVILCDIDHFKRINDTYGHSVGDRILKQVANQLRLAVGPDDHVARWGGEEFLILLNNTKSQRAVEIMERIRQAIENMTLIEGSQAVSITMTFGVCQYDGKGSFDSCIVKADKALYQGKKSGRNQVVLMK
jgi:diguanylate cyclase (GGDEF)-like protein